MGLFILPSQLFAEYYEEEEDLPSIPLPVKTPTTNLVSAWINHETGVFSICSNYDITCLYVTIEQNGVVLDSFSQPLYNGVPATYNFAGYSIGEYLVTLSTADGILSRYRVRVLEDWSLIC